MPGPADVVADTSRCTDAVFTPTLGVYNTSPASPASPASLEPEKYIKTSLTL